MLALMEIDQTYLRAKALFEVVLIVMAEAMTYRVVAPLWWRWSKPVRGEIGSNGPARLGDMAGPSNPLGFAQDDRFEINYL